MRAAPRSNRPARAAVLLALLALAALAPRALAQAPDPVAHATDLYGQGRFVDAVDFLQVAIDSGHVVPEQSVAVRELLARSLVKVGRPADARLAFLRMLREDRHYRPDPNKIPPDEGAIFDQALREFRAAQRRAPVSIGGCFGYATYDPTAINGAIARFSAFGGSTPARRIEGDQVLGGSVRLPLRPRLSLDLEMLRFRSSVSDSGRPSSPELNPAIRYEITALPLVASLYFEAWSRPGLRVNAFGGLGPMFATRMKWTESYATRGYDVGQRGEKTGIYGHLGFEGEYLFTRRVALSARVLGRVARANDVTPLRTSVASSPVGEPPVWGGLVHYEDEHTFDHKRVDFSGFGFDVGLRVAFGS
jgi:hypothetical protein